MFRSGARNVINGSLRMGSNGADRTGEERKIDVSYGRIVVVGSINMDLVNHVEAFPLPGETIHGLGTSYHAGGKGANQAVAAAQAGAAVAMLGAVGTDPFGGTLLEGLTARGVDASGVLRKDGTSGLAFITVNRGGENTIILSAGSNGRLEAADVSRGLLEGAGAVLLQNEIPWETNRHVMAVCRELGVRVFYNPAPASDLPEDVLPLIDTLIMNETEAEVISGAAVTDAESAAAAASCITAKGVRQVIVTMGGKGSLHADRHGGTLATPAFRITPVDTTAAGDTFIGAYAAAICGGMPLAEALRFASAAAALTVMKEGAQESIPSRAQVLAFLEQ